MNKNWLFDKITAYNLITDLPIKAYDKNRDFLFEQGKIESPYDFLGDFDTSIFSVKKLYKNYNNQNNEYFILVNIDNRYGKFYILVGPFMYHSVTYNELMEIAKANHIPSDNIHILRKYFSSVKTVKHNSLMHHYQYLAQLFEIDDSILDDNSTDLYERKAVEKNKLEYREIDFFHHNYLIENMFFHHFFNGRLTKTNIDDLTNVEPGLIADDYLKSTKNLGIVSLALIERYAIEHGMDAHISFTIGDAFLRRLDKANNISDIRVLLWLALEEYSKTMKENNRKRYSKKINDAKNFIDHNLSMDFTLQDIADFVKMNPSYLSRLFKKEVGVNISDYILNEKIIEAKIMLDYSNYSLLEISDILNFSSKSYFIKCFKKVEGITPGEYKNK